MRAIYTLLIRSFHGWPLYFGGGPGPVAPPPPPNSPAPPAADSEAAKKKSSMDAKRRVGGQDAISGGILGSLKETTSGLSPTLGGSAKTYTGEA